MCGIVGFVDKNSLSLETIFRNSERGKYSFGQIDLSTLDFKKEKVDNRLHSELEDIYNKSIPTLLHFRQPTSTSRDNWIEEENYPLNSKSYLLIGNGVINATYYKTIRDEDNNNDLYYILKKIEQKGFQYLEQVEGCFAFAIICKTTKQVFLIRKDYPLYVSDTAFSSVEFEGSKLLKHGILLEWRTQNSVDLHLPSVYA